jgi:hypothetical protein
MRYLMNRLVLLLAIACMTVCCVGTRPVMAREGKSVEIRKPYANIYEYLDPKSNIIRQAKQGELFELVYAGTSWFQIRVKERVGWLERRAGVIIDTPPQRFLGIPVGVFIVFIVLLVLTLLGVALVIYRQLNAEA